MLGLAGFYLLRGTMGTPRTGRAERVIERFTPMDRYAHWFVAIVWVALAITGLILSLGKSVLLPLIGYTLFSWLATLSKTIHNFIGPLLIIGVPWLFVRFIRDNGIGGEDFKWFTNIIGYFKGHEYPSDRFNAGEKLVFWLVLTLRLDGADRHGAGPGLPELRPDALDDADREHPARDRRVPVDRAGVRAHLPRHDRPARARTARCATATSRESWAEHHHLRWYERILAGRARQKFVVPETKLHTAEAERVDARTRPA